MSKPGMLYFSPFPPMKSGISDYSAVLVQALSSRFDITLCIDDYRIRDENLKHFPVLVYGKDSISYESFEYLVYNIGNNPEFHEYIYECALKHPGLIILHDYILYYLFVGFYQNSRKLYSSVYNKLGIEDFLGIKEIVKERGADLIAQKDISSRFPMNKELIGSGSKIMVHSEYAKEKILETSLVDSRMVRHINLICQVDQKYQRKNKSQLFKKYFVPEDAVIISSFGYIAETKMNKEICHVVRKLAQNIQKKICYLMVGDGDYADDELSDGLIVKTGFTTIDEFNSFIEYSDIVVNMRYPSMGETSAAMLRILQFGKPCITNNGGWFTELPDDCVYKIEVDHVEDSLFFALQDLLEHPARCEELNMSAKKYIENEYNEDIIVRQISEFLKNQN